MIEIKRSKIEKIFRRSRLAKAGLVSAFVLAGCSESSQPKPTTPVKPTQPPVKSQNSLTESLNNYRDGVNFDKKARVVLNSCVAWGNVSGGITVTQNPGVDTVRWGDEAYSYFVFSYPDTDNKFPLIQQMNGPQAKVDKDGAVYGGGPSGTLLHVDLEKQAGNLVYAANRNLSDKPSFAGNGQVHHTDAQTGAPVMNTAITDGPFTSERVNVVCSALSKGAPIDLFGG